MAQQQDLCLLSVIAYEDRSRHPPRLDSLYVVSFSCIVACLGASCHGPGGFNYLCAPKCYHPAHDSPACTSSTKTVLPIVFLPCSVSADDRRGARYGTKRGNRAATMGTRGFRTAFGVIDRRSIDQLFLDEECYASSVLGYNHHSCPRMALRRRARMTQPEVRERPGALSKLL
jgi:hypothetical protein